MDLIELGVEMIMDVFLGIHCWRVGANNCRVIIKSFVNPNGEFSQQQENAFTNSPQKKALPKDILFKLK